MKKCPFCAEEIQDEAIKCKHCGSMLSDFETKNTLVPIVSTTKAKKSKVKFTLITVGVLILIIIGITLSLRDNSTPTSIVGNFMIKIKDEDYDAARKYLTNDASNIYDNSDFDSFREFFDPTEGVTLAQPDSIQIKGNEAVEEIIKHDLVNGSKRMVVNLRKSFFGWKIESLR